MSGAWGPLAAAALVLWALLAAALMVACRAAIVRAWRAPVFGRHVLVLESDDWGAGPLSQALALRMIADTLAKHRDDTGRHPLISLALVLAVPDGTAIAAGDGYRRIGLDTPMLAPVLSALRAGLEGKVFSFQLHGHEHFWPGTLAACTDPAAVGWLRQPPPAATERLPSHLQSRWVDASRLPSAPLPANQIGTAVGDEVAAYRRIVGESPAVVVPPTFVWTKEVERAWAAAGIEYVVTPGWRSTQRNAKGVPDSDEGPIMNGDRGPGGVTYLVRSDYFEPARGRDAAYALRALEKAAVEGHPCVLENHRDNFIFDADQCRRSLTELDALCAGALRQHPDLRFLSTVELGRILRDLDPQWIAVPWRQRLPFVWQRLRHSGRLWKLMQLTGLATLGGLLVRLLAVRSAAPSAAAGS
jgi:hypothetical protein